MFHLVESIRIKDGKVYNLKYHLRRINRAKRELYNILTPTDLSRVLKKVNTGSKGIFKCRVIYNQEETWTEIKKYKSPLISSAKLIFNNSVEYKHKYIARRELEILYNSRDGADEIIIVKNGFITDAYYFNIILLIDGEFLTPQYPLLNGVMRQFLIDRGKIKVAKLSVNSLKVAEKIFFINALNPLGKIVLLPNQIKF
jgi:4-amino-4-deoxychorismate lyase